MSLREFVPVFSQALGRVLQPRFLSVLFSSALADLRREERSLILKRNLQSEAAPRWRTNSKPASWFEFPLSRKLLMKWKDFIEEFVHEIVHRDDSDGTPRGIMDNGDVRAMILEEPKEPIERHRRWNCI